MGIDTIANIAMGAFALAILVALLRNRPLLVRGAAPVVVGLAILLLARLAGPKLVPGPFYFHMGDYIEGLTFSIAIYVAFARRFGMALVLGLCLAMYFALWYSALAGYYVRGGTLEEGILVAMKIMANRARAWTLVAAGSPWLLLLSILYAFTFKKLRALQRIAPELALVGALLLVVCQETVPGFIPNTLDPWDIPAGILGAAVFYLTISKRDRPEPVAGASNP